MQTEIHYIRERLKLIRGERSQSDFAQKYGVKSNTYCHLENKGKTISFALLKKITEQENINAQWLLTGIGPQYNIPPVDVIPAQTIAETPPDYKRRLAPTRPSSIPIVADIAAGESTIIYDDSCDLVDASEIIDEFFYSRLKYDNDNPVVFVRVSGDSMIPDFHDGDLLLIERNVRIDLIRKGSYGIFGTNGEWTFKRYNPFADTGVILLEPLNSKYNTLAIRPNILKIFGIVIALIRALH